MIETEIEFKDYEGDKLCVHPTNINGQEGYIIETFTDRGDVPYGYAKVFMPTKQFRYFVEKLSNMLSPDEKPEYFGSFITEFDPQHVNCIRSTDPRCALWIGTTSPTNKLNVNNTHPESESSDRAKPPTV